MLKNWQVQTLGLILLALLFLISTPLFLKKIPATLKHAAQQKLHSNGIDWVAVNAHGRNITLKGNAPNIQHHQQALSTLDQMYGVRHVVDEMSPRIVSPYTFVMRWTENNLEIKGYVSNQDDYNHFLESAFQLYGKENVSGDIQLGAGAPNNWADLLQSTLLSLSTMEQGIVDITNHAIHVSGKATTTATKQNIQQDLAAYTQFNYQSSMNIIAADAADLVCQQRFTKLLKSRNIQFQTGETTIASTSFPLLKKLSNTAALCSKSKITIVGHTDNEGSNASNIKLSEKRAQAVVAWLFQQGIEMQRLSAVGHGAKNPVADNDTEQGRARNRRIEFIVGGK